MREEGRERGKEGIGIERGREREKEVKERVYKSRGGTKGAKVISTYSCTFSKGPLH